MPTKEERLPHRAIEELCAALDAADRLVTLTRSGEVQVTAQRIRRHVERANGLICRAWFPRDTLSDLPPAA